MDQPKAMHGISKNTDEGKGERVKSGYPCTTGLRDGWGYDFCY